MDLREFLEYDIIDFLDEHLSAEFLRQQSIHNPQLEKSTASGLLTQDYEQQLFDALETHNIIEAKRVLHAVKDEFSKYPLGSPEQQHLKMHLHSLYRKFKEHLEEESTFNKMERAIDDMDGGSSTPHTKTASAQKELKRPSRPPHHHAHAKKHPEKKRSILPSRKPISKQRPSEIRATQIAHEEEALALFLREMQALTDDIEHGDLKQAHLHYRKSKALFSILPKEKKKAHHHQMLHHHARISELQNAGFDAQFAKAEREIGQALADDDNPKAMAVYERLRSAVNSLRPVEGDRWKARLLGIHQTIDDKRPRKEAPRQDSILDKSERRLEHKLP